MTSESLPEKMRAKINAEKTHKEFGMTSYEEAFYRCSPTFFAFLAKYILCLAVLGVHVLFWWINNTDGLGDDANGLLKFLIWIVDLLGMTGFVFMMLILTWFNRFMNWSSSGSWFTISLLLVTFTPGLFVLDNFISTISGWFGGEFDGVIPFDWNDKWYIILGVVYSSTLAVLITYYKRSFSYGFSNRALYLKKNFMLTQTMHNITLLDIDNLKLNQPWYGRILGFGTVNVLTGSGFGVSTKTASTAVGAGVADAASAAAEDIGFMKKVFRALFFVIKLQRTREEMNTSEPEDCLYGIRKPQEIYNLINELKEKIRMTSVDQRHGKGIEENTPEAAQPAPVQEVQEAPVDSNGSLDDLDVDMNLG